MATSSGYKDSELGLDKAEHVLFTTSGEATKSVTIAPTTRDVGSPHGSDFLRFGLVLVPINNTLSQYHGMYTNFFGDYDIYSLEVTGTTDGNHTVTINGTAFTFVAATNTEEEIRDGLIALINVGAEPVVAAPVGTTEMTLTATTLDALVVAVSADLTSTAVTDPGDGTATPDYAVILKQNIKVGAQPVTSAAWSSGHFKASLLFAPSTFTWSKVQRLKRHTSL